LSNAGQVQWNGEEGLTDNEPSQSYVQRVQVFLWSLLPLDSQL